MIKKTWCVYMHRSPSNKAYIGITGSTPERRWDRGRGYKRQSYFWRAICKYGWDNFEHIIFADGLIKSEACHMERLLIAIFDTTNKNNGYNIEIGGESGLMSEETKKKISEVKRGKVPSIEARANMSAAQKLRWTEEERQKRSDKYSGDGNPMYGVHRFGEDAPMYGKKHSEESKAKMSKTKHEMDTINRIPVLCVETSIIYSSSYEANRQTGVCQQNIAACCRYEKHRKTAGGYHWEYVSTEEAC